MRATAGFFLALLLIASPVRGDSPAIIDAPTAQARVAAGEITLIDIRSPAEWRKTGVPHGATTVTIHSRTGIRGFVAETARILENDKDRPVALICATGGRSAVAAEALRKAGFTNVLDIREGMHGNRTAGPGWLARKLPVDDCKSC